MSLIFVYTVFKNKKEAESIAKVLLDKKLIACANILGEVDSLYEWNGEICSQKESAAIFKTQKRLFEELKELIISMHSYETPAVVAFESCGANDGFLEWVGRSVKA